MNRPLVWLGRLAAVSLMLLPLIALVFGPRTGDHFTDLWHLGLVVVISWPVALVIANLSNNASVAER